MTKAGEDKVNKIIKMLAAYELILQINEDQGGEMDLDTSYSYADALKELEISDHEAHRLDEQDLQEHWIYSHLGRIDCKDDKTGHMTVNYGFYPNIGILFDVEAQTADVYSTDCDVAEKLSKNDYGIGWLTRMWELGPMEDENYEYRCTS